MRWGGLTVCGERPNAVVVPPGALRGAGGAAAEVVLCDHGHARVRPVEVGARAADAVEIVRGVEAGDRVVSDGALGLNDGAAIVEGR